MTKRISTAAYLAGVTTIAVSLPMMASARIQDSTQIEDTKAQTIAQSDIAQSIAGKD